jgi:MraZ protein
VFVGSYTHAIDSKGRLSVPRKFLDSFAPDSSSATRMFFATQGLDGCVFLFPKEEWETVVAQVRENSLGSEEARAFSRRFFASTRELEVDASGRILLPRELRDFAAIGSEALFVGVDTRIELWSPQRWATHDERHGPKYEEHAKGIFRA